MNDKKLVRNMRDKMICGVCAGIADYLNVDVTVVRLIIAMVCLFSAGTAFLAYIVAAFIIPEGDRY